MLKREWSVQDTIIKQKATDKLDKLFIALEQIRLKNSNGVQNVKFGLILNDIEKYIENSATEYAEYLTSMKQNNK